MTYCCEQMRRQVEHSCDVHSDLSECPDSLIVRNGDTGEFGLRVHDGGSSFITIRHCPWCGTDLLERVSNKELGPPALKVAGFQLWVHGRQFRVFEPPCGSMPRRSTAASTGGCGPPQPSLFPRGPWT